MKKITTSGKYSKNRFILIDDEDYPLVSLFKWCIVKRKNLYYATSFCYNPEDKKSKGFYLHRFIMKEPEGDIDHKNDNGLDCRKNNLRICTRQQNVSNSKKWAKATSVYKGVYWNSQHNNWKAALKVNGKTVFCRTFKKEEDAARAYNKSAIKYLGEFAQLNIMGNRLHG